MQIGSLWLRFFPIRKDQLPPGAPAVGTWLWVKTDHFGTDFRTYVSGDWDVHDLDFDPWPHVFRNDLRRCRVGDWPVAGLDCRFGSLRAGLMHLHEPRVSNPQSNPPTEKAAQIWGTPTQTCSDYFPYSLN